VVSSHPTLAMARDGHLSCTLAAAERDNLPGHHT
jgi:hypothetical protein